MPSRRHVAGGSLFAVGVGASVATCGAAAQLESEVVALSVAGLGIEAGLVLIALAGALLSARPVTQSLGLLRSRLSGRRLLLLVVGTLGLSHALDCLLSLSGLREQSALADFDALLAGTRGAELALAFAAMGIAPALGEELLCRGWVQRGLQSRLGGVPALGIAALLFGLLHLDPIHAVFAIFLGLYLGTVALWAASTWPGIVCHGVNNTVAVLLAAGVLPDLPMDAVGAAAGLGLSAAALWAARPPGAGAVSAHPTRSTLQRQARSDDP